MKLVIVASFFFIAMCGLVAAADFNPRRALLDRLKEKADFEVPPQPDLLPIKVQVSMKLMRIVDVCPEIHCVKIFALEMYNWTDPRLKWNPENYGGIDYMPVDVEHLWLPDVDIAGDKYGRSMKKRFREDKATVLSTGSVLLIAPQKLEILCNGTVWQQNSGSSPRISQNARDQRQRQLQQMRSVGKSKNTKEATYVCEFFQTSWMYDTDVVEVVPASGKDNEEQFSSSMSRSRQMRIREGGPTSSYGEEEEDEEYHAAEENEDFTTTSYPWRNSPRRSQQQQRSSGRQEKGGKKPVPFSQWTTTASSELFEANDKYDLASFTARREFNSLPFAPERQWSTIYYQIGIIDKKPERDMDSSSKSSSFSKTTRQQQQQQQEEQEEEEEEQENEEQDSMYHDSNNIKLSQKQSKSTTGELKRRSREQQSRSGGSLSHQYGSSSAVEQEYE